MISSRVLSEKELHDRLRALGYTKTNHKTQTSTVWQHPETGLAIQVPPSIDGYYPDWLLWKLEAAVEAKLTLG